MEQLGDILKKNLDQRSTSRSTGTPPRDRKSETSKCPICGGTGRIVLDVPVDHPDFGKSFPCECTLKKLSNEKRERLERYSNLGPLRRLSFDNLEAQGLDDNPKSQEQFRSCYEEAEFFANEPSGWLVFIGPTGCGKTHMAAAIANKCIQQGMAALWVIIPDFLDHLRSTFSPKTDISYDEFFERVKNVPLLFLDDLGTHTSTPWAEEKLFQVLNHRFNAQLPTVVTTISLDDLDERLQSRLKSPGLSRVLELKKETPQPLKYVGELSEEMLHTMRIENFDTRGMNASKKEQASLKRVLEAVRDFAESPEAWLVLVGPPGSGKTHLAVAIANYQADCERPASFVSIPELLDHLRSGAMNGQGQEISLEEIKTAPLIIFDDLGMESTSGWAREKIYQILNFRYNARLATVVTATNPVMDNLDVRLRSRLMDPKISNVVPLAAPDYRGQSASTTRAGRRR